MNVKAENLIVGGVAAFGALAYCLWNFRKVYLKTKETPEVEKLNWTKLGMTIAPSIATGFLAGYYMDPSLVELVPVMIAGWGAADLGAEVGVNSYFD